MALARTNTKQNVPAFLNKLNSMVSDPTTDHLIHWSEDGESFYVPNHEQFGREVLPRFFKHSNFSSFVRQLNMYGFHKVPHLQQGVLKNETENELWQFSNPNFKRGLPDLLPFIERKKGERDGEGALIPGPRSGVGGSGAGGLDLRGIVTGIAAIKRHQNAISTDLKELQNSNRALWQEAMNARERHQQHQDTINKILRFLAGVFGSGAGMGATPMGAPSPAPASSSAAASTKENDDASSSSVVPRKRPRLMLSDGRPSGKGKRKAPNEGEEDYVDRFSYDPNLGDTSSMSNRFSEVTPSELGTTADLPPELGSTAPTPTHKPPHLSTEPPYIKRSPSEQTVPTSTGGALSRRPSLPDPNTSTPDMSQFSFSSPGPSGSGSNTDQNGAGAANSVFASTLQALLNSPNSAQRLLASLAMPQGQQYTGPSASISGGDQSDSRQLQYPYAPSQPSYAVPPNWSSAGPSDPPIIVSPPSQTQTQPQPQPDYTTHYPTTTDRSSMLQAVTQNTNALQRATHNMDAINGRVSMMDESINSLMQTLGLDLSTLEHVPAAAADGVNVNGNGTVNPGDTQDVKGTEDADDGVPSDFDVEAFLNQFNSDQANLPNLDQFNTDGAGLNPMSMSLDAFLDEVSTQSAASTPPVFGDMVLPDAGVEQGQGLGLGPGGQGVQRAGKRKKAG